MWPDRVSKPESLALESDELPATPRGPAETKTEIKPAQNRI